MHQLSLLLRPVVLCASAAFIASPAAAHNVKMKDMIASDREKVSSLAKEANQACGTSIAFSVDYASYAKIFEDENNQRPWAYLANVTDAFKSLCRTDAGKQAIRDKIKAVTVVNAASESESLSSGTFRYTVPYSGHSPASVVKWLQTNL